MVTVIIPTLRRPRLLARAIRSVQAQTMRDLTIAVTDNASRDSTPDLVRSMMALDPRIRYHEQPTNLGPHANFQHALERVETPYFTMLSDDDLMLPEFVAHSMSELERAPDAMFVASPVLLVDPNGQLLMVYGDKWRPGTHFPPQGLLDMSRKGHFIWTGIVFRTSVRDSVRLDPQTGNSSDMDFQLQVAARYPFVTSGRPGAIFSWHPQSPSSHPDLAQFWPSWGKIMANLDAVETLPRPVRSQAIANLDKRLHRSLVLVGLYAASRRRWDDAAGAARLLVERYRDLPAAAVIRSTAWPARRLPMIPPILYWVAWQLRWAGRARLKRLQRELDIRYGALLALDDAAEPQRKDSAA
ncbi:MAG TPA: glycosyltransferase family 2 protein [Candidatus Dormibacteraeota bacterium]